MPLKLSRNSLIALGLLALCSGTALISYIVTEQRIFPYPIIKAAESKVLALTDKLRHPAQENAEPQTAVAFLSTPLPATEVASIFVRLSMQGYQVNMPETQKGGGMTSFLDELLLVNQIGQIFLVDDKQVTHTSIQAPENGLMAYAAAATDPEFEAFNIQPRFIRYNDIQFYRNDQQQGLVLSYTEWRPEQRCYNTAVARLLLADDVETVLAVEATPQDWEILYRSQPCLPLKDKITAIEGHQAGGRIAFKAPATLYLASGDYGWDGVYAPGNLPQDPENDYGKVIAIDLNGGKAQRLTIGNRNMQGILVDDTGQLWATEHGPRGGDELNKIEPGKNYGWPLQTLGTRYNHLPWPDIINYGRHDKFEAPFIAFVPSIAISNLIQVDNFHPSWDGDLLIASLNGKSLFRVRKNSERVIFIEPVDLGKRIRYVHQHTDGRLLIWTDKKELIFIDVAEQGNVYAFIDELLNIQIADESLREDVSAALLTCMTCHSFDESASSAYGPSLSDVYGRNMGESDFGGYSDALKNMQGQWDHESLRRYIDDPGAVAPGTTMPDPGIDDPAVINGMIDVLRQLQGDWEQ